MSKLRRWLILLAVVASLLLTGCQGESGHPRAKKVYASLETNQPQVVWVEYHKI